MRTRLGGWAFIARLVVALLLCACAPAAFAQTFPPSFAQTGAPSGTVIPEASFTMTVTVSSGASFTPNGFVDIELYDSTGTFIQDECSHSNQLNGAGQWTCTFTAPIPEGNYYLQTHYYGDNACCSPQTMAGFSAQYPFTALRATSSISQVGGPSGTVTAGASFTMTATVSSTGPAPTGMINFKLYDQFETFVGYLCSENNPLVDGQWTCTFNAPAPGANYFIDVAYDGDTHTSPGDITILFSTSSAVVVTNTNDSGPGSLRDAISFVNSNCSGQTITFNLPVEPVGPKTIHLTSALPRLTCNNMSIDGYSQPGASRNTATTGNNAVILIELDGSGAGPVNGIEIGNSASNIAGIAIGGFNGSGIAVFAPLGTLGMQLSGVFIGTDATGTLARPNVNGVHTTPGSTGLGACDGSLGGRNLVSGNISSGIRLESGDFTFVCNTYIGTNASGNAALANGGIGIEATGTTRTQILGNVISGNGSDGVYIGASQPGVVITGNFIGTGVDGTTSLGNSNMGITINTDGVTVGGDPGSAGNVIADNRFDGVNVATGNNNAIQGNSIYGNGRLGISLTLNGSVLANDSCDADGGSNAHANWPVLSSVTSSGGTTTIVGTHNSTASTTFHLEFFSNLSTDAAANRAGRTVLGSVDAVTDASCNAAFNISLPIALSAGDLVTATSTDPSGNTSGFSNAVAVAAAAPTPTITAIRPASGGTAGGSAVVIEGTNLDTLTSVTFAGNPATINFSAATSITVTAPPNATGGPVDVVVTNSGGGATSTSGFNYAADDNLARDFSVAMNPSPRWTYGYEPAAYGAFTPFSTHFRSGSADIWWFGNEPTILHNFSASPYSPACCNAVAPGGILMHPGPGGEKSVVRWTAPTSGSYHIAGAFTGLDGAGTTTDVAVMRNNNAAAKLFSANVFDTGVAHSFALDAALNSGETIEFSVGFGNGSFASDSTGLDATITRTGPRPNSAVSLSLTSLTFGAEIVGRSSPPQRITLTNTGTDPLTIFSMTITGTDSASFTKSTTCVSPIAVGASCTVDVSFVPTINTGLAATLTFNTDAPTSPDTVFLGGLGLVPPTLGISTFSTVVVGGVSTLGLTISNVGSNTMTFSGVSSSITYPAGWTNDPARAIQTSCGASVSGVAGGNSIAETNGAAAPGVGCHLVNAQILAPATPGTYTFTVPAGGFTIASPVAYSNPSPITFTVTVTATPPPAAVSLAPASIAFGSQAVNTTSATQAVTLTNTGGLALGITSITVGTGFTKSNGSPACATTLAAGASCVINVAFAPTAATPYSASLTIVDSASGSPHSVTLTGTGTPPMPALGITPASLTFAARTVGTTSTAQTITVTNNGPGTLNIAAIAVSGDYAFTSACPTALAQGATCTIDVTFTPVAEGTRIGSLTITSNASGSPHAVTLSGTGQPAAVGVLEASPSPVTFDPQALNTPSAPQLLTLHNAGTATVNRGPPSVDGDFKLLTGTDADTATHNQTCTAALAPGASCSLALVFTPTALGTRSGLISLPNDTSTPVLSVHLFGTGANATIPRALTVQPQLLAFSSQAVGTRSEGKTVTLTNTLTSAAVITDLSTSTREFIVSDTCTTIASRASCSPLVTFQPTAVGARNATLTIRTFAETDPYTVQLTGTGVFNATPELEVTPTRIGFGNVLLGGGATLGFTLRNIGLVPVVLGTISVLDDFVIASGCPTTLDPGVSCAVQVMFFPHTLGVHAATVDIFSNAANSPHHVDLSGSACAIPLPTRSRVQPVLCGR